MHASAPGYVHIREQTLLYLSRVDALVVVSMTVDPLWSSFDQIYPMPSSA